jgi:hypothetical protein
MLFQIVDDQILLARRTDKFNDLMLAVCLQRMALSPNLT